MSIRGLTHLYRWPIREQRSVKWPALSQSQSSILIRGLTHLYRWYLFMTLLDGWKWIIANMQSWWMSLTNQRAAFSQLICFQPIREQYSWWMSGQCSQVLSLMSVINQSESSIQSHDLLLANQKAMLLSPCHGSLPSKPSITGEKEGSTNPTYAELRHLCSDTTTSILYYKVTAGS